VRVRRDHVEILSWFAAQAAWRPRTVDTYATPEVCMPVTSEITFHNLEPSDAVSGAVERWIARLDHVYARILACDVVIDRPHLHQRRGCPFRVSVFVKVPGRDLAAHSEEHDAYVAIAEAFRSLRRQLVDAIDVRRGDVKTHVVERTGRVGVNVGKQRAGF
jgi:ribosomal subunit interface protein